jgi:2-oxoglutarate dehydrogenase complex dehydrogenase (E1) component-like enzyme
MREAAESGRYLPALDPVSAEGLLDRITQVEVFERFLQRTFPGKTRFSIEGLDMLLPILDELMAGAAGTGTRHMMLGMAHRGRLNVLAHILQKPYAQILAEFKDPVTAPALRLDLIIIAGHMGHFKGEGECIGIILNRVTDHGAGEAYAFIDRSRTFCVQFIHGHEIFGAGAGGRDDQIDDRAQDQQTAE